MVKFIVDSVYPERRFGGFTRVDGTVAHYTRIQALLRPGDVVLDLGCGRGAGHDDSCAMRRRVRDLRGEGRTVIGVDVDRDAQQNSAIDEFRVIEDVSRWPVGDATVDIIHSDYVLEHVENPDAFFSEAARVLKDGGHMALRTPNARSYAALASRLIPDRFHARVLSRVQENRKAEDVFPTVYRCNTAGRLHRVLSAHGFDGVVYAAESEPGYMAFSRLTYRLAATAHAMMPPMFRSTLLVYAQKIGRCAPP